MLILEDLGMDGSKIYNYICKFMGQQIERINRLKKEKSCEDIVMQKLNGCIKIEMN